MAPQTAISKAVCYKTKNEQLWEKAVHFLLVATNCFYAGLPTVFCTITGFITLNVHPATLYCLEKGTTKKALENSKAFVGAEGVEPPTLCL